MAEADCVIVGGGIGGAVLALALGRRGHRVALLERDTTAPAIGRPEILAQSTLDAFQQLGVGARMRQEAVVPLHALQLWRAGDGRLLTLSADDFRQAGAQPYSTNPLLTRRILLEAAATLGSVQIQRGVEVQALLREGGAVVGVRARRGAESITWKALLVVGDDGGQSRIRQSLGIPLATRDLPVDFLSAAGPVLPGQTDGVGEAWLNPGGIRRGLFGGIFMPLPAGQTALVFLLSPAAMQRFRQGPAAAFYEAAAQLSPRCQDLERHYRFPEGFSHIRRPFGHAPHYVADGAALLGDAAHPVTPAGGQGANMSVADAIVLAEVAHAALSRRDCSAARLSAYEAIRRPANTRSLRFSSRTKRTLDLFSAVPWLAALFPAFLHYVERTPSMKQQLIRAVSRAFASPAST